MAKNKGIIKTLSRSDIMSATDLKREFVEIDDWNGGVYVHSMTGDERDAFENQLAGARNARKGKLDIRGVKARCIINCVRDADGKLLFNSSDINALNAKSAKPLDILFQVAQRLSGITDDEVEELRGNSETAPNVSSGSA